MSRRREQQRQKERELARQLGDSDVDPEALSARARVSRPVLRVLSHTARRNALVKLIAGSQPKEHLILALYVVESHGARLLDAVALDDGERRLDKVTYHRPAHFVLVACTAREPKLVVEAFSKALQIDGKTVDDTTFASDAWEKPHAVALAGLPSTSRGAAVSIRGVARAVSQYELSLETSVAVVEVEI